MKESYKKASKDAAFLIGITALVGVGVKIKPSTLGLIQEAVENIDKMPDGFLEGKEMFNYLDGEASKAAKRLSKAIKEEEANAIQNKG